MKMIRLSGVTTLILLACVGAQAHAASSPIIAGHWTGNVVWTREDNSVATYPLDWDLQQNGKEVTGTLKLTVQLDGRVITVGPRPVKGYFEEQSGRVTLLVDFAADERARFRLTVQDNKMVGNSTNMHDEPKKWPRDATGPVTLDRAPSR